VTSSDGKRGHLEAGLAAIAGKEELVTVDIGAVQVGKHRLRGPAQLAGHRRLKLAPLLACDKPDQYSA
jgi:hypothetical protein